ncbi:Ankyrin repeat family protein [Euphorbia peplus]|nr:Ankyrin repeat family protein [Euphorbia peplus]
MSLNPVMEQCPPLILLHAVMHSCGIGLWKILAMLVPLKEIRGTKMMHHQTLKLVKCLCTEIICQDFEKAFRMLKKPFLLAAELGILEVVEEIMENFPHAIWFSDYENRNLFQIAVVNRQANIFNLLYQMSDYKHLLLVSEDIFGNNILHLAGKLAPQHRLNLISGAALQMQYELHWFKEVEKAAQLSCKEDKNSEGKTPAMLFTEEHKGLVKEGEKWMKDAASSCTVAAAITVPGGNNNGDGYPIFSKQKAFIVFAISDALSLFSSVAAILMFLSILTARYAEADFLYTLPKRLIFGLVTLHNINDGSI